MYGGGKNARWGGGGRGREEGRLQDTRAHLLILLISQLHAQEEKLLQTHGANNGQGLRECGPLRMHAHAEEARERATAA